jgi:hypothetical protein
VAAFFKIDGDTVEVDARSRDDPLVHKHLFRLKGPCTLVATPGSHDNLGVTSVGAGDDVPIPAAVGRQAFMLRPIPFPPNRDGGDPRPGVIGVVVALMEENRTSDAAADAGHAAFDKALEQGINEIIPTLVFDEFGTATGEQPKPTSEQIDALKAKVHDAARGSKQHSRWGPPTNALDPAIQDAAICVTPRRLRIPPAGALGAPRRRPARPRRPLWRPLQTSHPASAVLSFERVRRRQPTRRQCSHWTIDGRAGPPDQRSR